MKFVVKRKPARCPQCGSTEIAGILYGLPAWDEQLEKQIDNGEIVLGGCMVSDDDAKWICNECAVRIYQNNGENFF